MKSLFANVLGFSRKGEPDVARLRVVTAAHIPRLSLPRWRSPRCGAGMKPCSGGQGAGGGAITATRTGRSSM